MLYFRTTNMFNGIYQACLAAVLGNEEEMGDIIP